MIFVAEEHRDYHGKYLPPLVFTLIFLKSFGITHSTFADKVIATISLGGQHPAEMGVNPNTDKVYVTNPKSDAVYVIDGSTNSVVSTIQVGISP